MTSEEITELLRDMLLAPSCVFVGGANCLRLFASMGVKRGSHTNDFVGVDVFAEPLLPNDFMLMYTERDGDSQLLVFRLREGRVEAFEVMKPFPLYPVWMHMIRRHMPDPVLYFPEELPFMTEMRPR